MSRTLLAPPGVQRRIQFTVLWLVVLAAIGLLAGWIASRFGLSAIHVLAVGVSSAFVAEVIIFLVPVHISSELSDVLPGQPEQLFELAANINLGLKVSGNPRRARVIKETGVPGQTGSTYILEASGLVTTTTVVSSDPPRQLVTKMTSRYHLSRADVSRTYTPVPDGTRLEIRARQRIPLGAWLIRPVFKREAQSILAQQQVRLRDYLASAALAHSSADRS